MNDDVSLIQIIAEQQVRIAQAQATAEMALEAVKGLQAEIEALKSK